MRRRLLVAAALIASISSPAVAEAENVALPATGTPLSSAPPLLSGVGQQAVPVFSGSLSSQERVTARIDPAGKVRGVNVFQRLVVPTGDFFFSIPAPAEDVEVARGSGSQPGLRQNAILWQGFSPGRRILASDARLRLRQSAPYLPLGVAARTRVDGTPIPAGSRRSGRLDLAVRLVNRTGGHAVAFTAPARAPDLVSLLDQIRRLRAGNRSFAPFVRVSPPLHKTHVFVRAPLRVRGTFFVPLRRFDGHVTGGRLTKTAKGVRIRVSRVLGDGRPPILTVRLQGKAVSVGPPKANLAVEPMAPERELRPPGSRTWLEAFTRGRTPSTRRLLALANSSLLTLAKVGQYENYLTNPDSTGRTRTTYRYVSGAPPAAAQPASPAPTEKEGVSPWALLAFGIGAGAAILALTVLWARS